MSYILNLVGLRQCLARKVLYGETISRAGELRRSACTSGPGLFWVTFFLFVPLLAIVGISFLSRGPYGGVEWPLTTDNFKRVIGFGVFGFDPLYPRIVLRSIVLAFGTTVFCVLLALPVAFLLARLPVRARMFGLLLLIIPFWTNLLIRTYAWQIIFSAHGWLARSAAAAGLIAPGEALYPGTLAVFIVLVADFLPVMALPLYASVEKVDWSLAEAANDLGANSWGVFWHAVLPQIRPGLMAGSILVFVAATGQFVIPDLMGGAKTALLGSAIQQQFGVSRDWPFGSAIACLAVLIVMAGLWIFARTAGEEGRKALL